MKPRTVIQVMEAASGVTPERWTPPAPELRARLLEILGHALDRPDVVLFRCNPEEALHAELAENHRIACEEHERELDLAHIVEAEVRPSAPVLLCSVSGYDASGRIDDLAAEMGRPVTSIAIGSAEGFNQADKAINSAVKTGR